jgi:REP element-mobilizing transposase RayT
MFDFPNTWGGVRKNAGRKPKGDEAGVRHAPRQKLKKRFPVHVVTRTLDSLEGLRNPKTYFAMIEALRAGCRRAGFRLIHYSIQNTHIHLLVEADDETALARGLQGLFVRIARALNRVWKRKGRVFADRYFSRILRTPAEVKNALRYVFFNGNKHREAAGLHGNIDFYSSAPWFDGWDRAFRLPGDVPREGPIAKARTWLLSIGWRRHGLLPVGNAPESARVSAWSGAWSGARATRGRRAGDAQRRP